MEQAEIKDIQRPLSLYPRLPHPQSIRKSLARSDTVLEFFKASFSCIYCKCADGTGSIQKYIAAELDNIPRNNANRKPISTSDAHIRDILANPVSRQ